MSSADGRDDAHIVLLGDLLGTKSALLNNDFASLAAKLDTVHKAVSNEFMRISDRSKNCRCYTYSDSILVIWSDWIEGMKYCIEFADNVYREVHELGYRFFIDIGLSVRNKTGLAPVLTHLTSRYHCILPVSMALWAVSVAEAGHFPRGIFVGRDLSKRLLCSFETEEYKAGEFSFQRISRSQ